MRFVPEVQKLVEVQAADSAVEQQVLVLFHLVEKLFQLMIGVVLASLKDNKILKYLEATTSNPCTTRTIQVV